MSKSQSKVQWVPYFSVGYKKQLRYGVTDIVVEELCTTNMDFLNERIKELQPQWAEELIAVGRGLTPVRS